MTSITTQEYWDLSYEKLDLVYNPNNILFKDLFDKYLKPNGTCLEIGCYPGNYLVYLGSQFNYEVSGIDTTPFLSTRLPLHLTRNRVKIGKLYNENFLTFNPNEKYDVVCSFGFIEHFTNFEAIIEKHIQLTKPSGTLIITCPNFRKIQYLLHKCLDSDNLKRHNLASMDTNRWTNVLQNNNMKILYHGYYRTSGFWTDSPNNGLIKNYISIAVRYLFKHIDQRVNLPNPWVSPYIVLIAQKLEEEKT
ncbi:MAG TPA: class I SAM-dependent methyltransferase [Methanosarcina sp.]|nr:class I SAM-dependent methyltransferase [Methanosarcina sp.]